MAERYDRPPHPEGPFNADRVADSAPPGPEELDQFEEQMRSRAWQRGLLFLAALALAASLTWATRHEPAIAAYLGASLETVATLLLLLAVIAIVVWGFALYHLLGPVFGDWVTARSDLQRVDQNAPDVKRVLLVCALINQAATGYLRTLNESGERSLRLGDLRAIRQYLRQVKNPNIIGVASGPPKRPEDDLERGYVVWSEHSYRFFLDEGDTLDYIEFLDGDLEGVAIFFGRPGDGYFPYRVTDCPEAIRRYHGSQRNLQRRIDEELEEVIKVFGGWGRELTPI